jgi:glycosyltransferase involved in cell wall biosynthesis
VSREPEVDRAMAGRSGKLRVGWIIGDQLEKSAFVRGAALSGGGIGRARYLWVANYVDRQDSWNTRYEIYRPWKRYDAIIFLKSLGDRTESVAERARTKGTKVVFDVNVNYYDVGGETYYENMLPTTRQQEEAQRMTRIADAVIADSEYLRDQVKPYNRRVDWIPDCVDMEVVPDYVPWTGIGRKLPLFWSGQSLKLFELLAVEDVLREFKNSIELVLVTNSMASLERWHEPVRKRFRRLLDDIPHRIVPFKSIEQLFDVYGSGGAVISPRFMDNTYNLGHTEWKITLGMACGRIAVCSRVPSYLTVAERARGRGIRVCRNGDDWKNVLEELSVGRLNLRDEEHEARRVVAEYYSAANVARQHRDFMCKVVDGGPIL